MAGRVRLGAREILRGQGRGTRLASATLVAMLAAAFAFSAPATAQDAPGDAPKDVSTSPTDSGGASDAPDAGSSEGETEPAPTEPTETAEPSPRLRRPDRRRLRTTRRSPLTTPPRRRKPTRPSPRPRPRSAPRGRPDASLRTSPACDAGTTTAPPAGTTDSSTPPASGTGCGRTVVELEPEPTTPPPPPPRSDALRTAGAAAGSGRAGSQHDRPADRGARPRREYRGRRCPSSPTASSPTADGSRFALGRRPRWVGRDRTRRRRRTTSRAVRSTARSRSHAGPRASRPRQREGSCAPLSSAGLVPLSSSCPSSQRESILTAGTQTLPTADRRTIRPGLPPPDTRLGRHRRTHPEAQSDTERPAVAVAPANSTRDHGRRLSGGGAPGGSSAAAGLRIFAVSTSPLLLTAPVTFPTEPQPSVFPEGEPGVPPPASPG